MTFHILHSLLRIFDLHIEAYLSNGTEAVVANQKLQLVLIRNWVVKDGVR